jgi:hypothetical protein
MLMDTFFHFSLAKDYPHNMGSQYLLIGPRAFHNLSPKNVEAMLSTDFKGNRWRNLESSLTENSILTLNH